MLGARAVAATKPVSFRPLTPEEDVSFAFAKGRRTSQVTAIYKTKTVTVHGARAIMCQVVHGQRSSGMRKVPKFMIAFNLRKFDIAKSKVQVDIELSGIGKLARNQTIQPLSVFVTKRAIV